MSDTPLKTTGDPDPPGDTIKPPTVNQPSSESGADIKPPTISSTGEDDPPDDTSDPPIIVTGGGG